MQPANALQRGALISLEFLAIAGALYVGVIGFQALAPIVLPLLFALLLTALLAPGVLWLDRHGLPHPMAVIVVIAAFLLFVVGGLSWIVPTILEQAGRAASQAQDGLVRLPDLLKDLGIRSGDTVIHDATERAKENLGEIGASLSSSAFSVAAASVSVLFGTFLTFVLLTYFLWDGEGFWHGAVRMLAPRRREGVLLGGRRTAHALITFVRSQVVVALFDAIGIAIGLLLLGVPLVLPLAVLTFVLSFIPYVGATLSGLLIALVALSTQGPAAMIAILLIAVLVQFIEGHVVDPLLIGRNLKLHPITVLLAVGLGGASLGILGAFFATPLLAGVAAAAGLLPDQIDEAELRTMQQEMDAMSQADEADAAVPPPASDAAAPPGAVPPPDDVPGAPAVETP